MKTRFLMIVPLLLIVGMYSPFSNDSPLTALISVDPVASSIMVSVSHDPITIDSDADFVNGFPGIGTQEDPYRIENYEIIYSATSSTRGISIVSTTKYFVVQNCRIEETAATLTSTAVYVYDVAEGTANITGNTIERVRYGISISSSPSSFVAKNTVASGGSVGILIDSSDNSRILNNSISGYGDGISLTASNYVDVSMNTIGKIGSAGIRIIISEYVRISGNSLVVFNTGIFLVNFTKYNLITCNLLQYGSSYGVTITGAEPDYNRIYHNNFLENNPAGDSQANDIGTDNVWYDTTGSLGNYWSVWVGTGAYSIDGDASASDPFPLPRQVDVEGWDPLCGCICVPKPAADEDSPGFLGIIAIVSLLCVSVLSKILSAARKP